jgi:hypothetical protein
MAQAPSAPRTRPGARPAAEAAASRPGPRLCRPSARPDHLLPVARGAPWPRRHPRRGNPARSPACRRSRRHLTRTRLCKPGARPVPSPASGARAHLLRARRQHHPSLPRRIPMGKTLGPRRLDGHRPPGHRRRPGPPRFPDRRPCPAGHRARPGVTRATASLVTRSLRRPWQGPRPRPDHAARRPPSGAPDERPADVLRRPPPRRLDWTPARTLPCRRSRRPERSTGPVSARHMSAVTTPCQFRDAAPRKLPTAASRRPPARLFAALTDRAGPRRRDPPARPPVASQTPSRSAVPQALVRSRAIPARRPLLAGCLDVRHARMVTGPSVPGGRVRRPSTSRPTRAASLYVRDVYAVCTQAVPVVYANPTANTGSCPPGNAPPLPLREGVPATAPRRTAPATAPAPSPPRPRGRAAAPGWSATRSAPAPTG